MSRPGRAGSHPRRLRAAAAAAAATWSSCYIKEERLLLWPWGKPGGGRLLAMGNGEWRMRNKESRIKNRAAKGAAAREAKEWTFMPVTVAAAACLCAICFFAVLVLPLVQVVNTRNGAAAPGLRADQCRPAAATSVQQEGVLDRIQLCCVPQLVPVAAAADQ